MHLYIQIEGCWRWWKQLFQASLTLV